MTLARLLRAVAVMIAVLGAIDPVWTRPDTERPVVALVSATDATEVRTLSRALSRRFDVRTGAAAGAVATIVAGPSLPPTPPPVAGAFINVAAPRSAKRLAIERVSVPATAAANSTVPIDVVVSTRGVTGRSARIEALAGGVVLDRQVVSVKREGETLSVMLSVPALAPGLVPITVRVRDNATEDEALRDEAIVATEVRPVEWRVLVVDPRPSWMSTFVRRALEADRRFSVTSRVLISRGLSADSGSAPSFSDAAAIDRFDAIVVGAPDALSAADVQRLERFARNRGGSVVLLMDRVDGGAFARLTGAQSFADVHGVTRRTVAASVSRMTATELAVPVRLSPAATPLATVDGVGPVVWSLPVGAGQVIVSGALDTWRYRGNDGESFAPFWTHAAAEAADAAPPPVRVSAVRAVRARGAITAHVTVRDVALSDGARPSASVDVRATVTRVDVPDGTSGVAESRPVATRLWPTPERGVFVAEWTPPAAGAYRIDVDALSAAGAEIGTSSATVWVGSAGIRAPQDASAWTTANGGTILEWEDDAALTDAVAARVPNARPLVRSHPMRALWWLPVFVLVLGAEWWLRRQRGHR